MYRLVTANAGRLLCAVPLLCFLVCSPGWAADTAAPNQDWITGIRLESLANGEARLFVELAAPANLTLYYDNQLPKNMDILETFWFRERSEARSREHSFLLQEIEQGMTCHFRLASTWPAERRSEPMRFVLPSGNSAPIIIK